MDISKFKDDFILELQDHLKKMNDALLILEKEIKVDSKNLSQKKVNLLDDLMRSAHTVKSSSATMGFKDTAYLMHVLEDVFDYGRKDLLQIELTMIDEIFKSFDRLEENVKKIKRENKEIGLKNITEKIKKISGVKTSGTGKSKKKKVRSLVTKKNGLNKTEKEKEVIGNGEQDLFQETVSHIQVPVERLDSLLDLTEELLIDKMRINSLMDASRKRDQDQMRFVNNSKIIEEIDETFNHLGDLISNLQFHVMKSRLVPASRVFDRFPRMVRDLAKSSKKEIDMEIVGGDLELDRTIIDKLGEPLVHLLRNAVDHGITEKGKIKLSAKREKDFAVIDIKDNGQGIDWLNVVKAASTRKIIDEKTTNNYLEEIRDDNLESVKGEIAELLYNPNFSTNEKVTETSGRGVGMSVVKRFVENIGGRVFLNSPISEKGGSCFSLELPFTLAIINALLIEIGTTKFAVPFSSIERVVGIKKGEMKKMADQDIAIVDKARVPIIDLKKIFGIEETLDKEIETENQGKQKAEKNKNSISVETKESSMNAERNKQESEVKENKNVEKNRQTVILVKRGDDIAGLLVDKIIGEQEIIIKPLPKTTRSAQGFSGTTILGEGETVLILDVVNLIQEKIKN